MSGLRVVIIYMKPVYGSKWLGTTGKKHIIIGLNWLILLVNIYYLAV